MTLKKAGTCKIKGVQAGDAVYAAATAVTRQFTVPPTGRCLRRGLRGPPVAGGQPFRFLGAAIYGTSNPGAPN